MAVLNALQKRNSDADPSNIALPANFPAVDADQSALLQWAYFEASAIIKQYGDLLEDVSSYMGSGTSTVGECALMIESEMGQ